MPDNLTTTISATFAQVKVKVAQPAADNQNEAEQVVKLQLWDTAGDEKLRHITRNYYNGAAAACVVYDVTSAESLQVANDWIRSVRENVPGNCLIYLVGNKTDIIESIEVSKRQGEIFA